MENRISTLIDLIYQKDKEKDNFDKIAVESSLKSKDLEKEIESFRRELLSLLPQDTNGPVYSESNPNLLVLKKKTENVGYTNENDVIKWLLKNNYESLVRVTTKQALDKKPLKQQLKTDTVLQEGLNPYILKGFTEYVQVTNKENYEKMLEHFKED